MLPPVRELKARDRLVRTWHSIPTSETVAFDSYSTIVDVTAGSGALNPFPDAFQPRLSVQEVVDRAAPFIKGVDSLDQVTELLGGYAIDVSDS